MEDRPRPHHRLGSQEQVLDLEQVTVSQDRLQWRDLRVGAQDEDAVEACLLRELAGIDLERGPMLHLGGLQIAPIGGVPDEGLVTLLQLRIESGHDRLTVLAVFLGLSTFTSLANSCVSPFCRSTTSGTKGASFPITIFFTSASLRSRAPRMYSSLRSSSPAIVSAEIMPRSATTHTRPMLKRSRNRSITGNSVVTSAVLPGHISVQIGEPEPSTTRPRIICFRSGR